MKINRILLAFVSFLLLSCTNSAKDELVKIHTKYGDMLVVLHDATPVHKSNFLEIARSGKYDSTIFHRVMKDFMIQGGDTSNLVNGEAPGTIPAEIVSQYIHEKGALAAARKPDQINPNKESSSCQFYIVQGRKLNEAAITEFENRANFMTLVQHVRECMMSGEYPEVNHLIDSLNKIGNPRLINEAVIGLKDKMESIYGPTQEVKYTAEQKKAYTSVGGAPHLDGAYTVFGKVLEGLEVIDSVAAQSVDAFSKPLEDLHMKMSIVKMDKEEVTQKYGYKYATLE
ncbi:MAG: peptidylprolyl isomerase [Flammeovirgaceae bacterium]